MLICLKFLKFEFKQVNLLNFFNFEMQPLTIRLELGFILNFIGFMSSLNSLLIAET